MEVMDKTKDLPPEQQFIWTEPGWLMSKTLDDWEGQSPERRKRLDEYRQAGKLQFHALPFTLESDICEPEEMARGFIFASNLARKYHVPLPRSGKMTDVPSHGGALATVLAQGGVQFAHIGCNWPSPYVSTPGLFWWEGPDGSRVLTFYTSQYGTATGFGGPSGRFIGNNFLPCPGWPYRVWPAIIVTIDNSGPPSVEVIKKCLDEARRRLPGVKIRMGTLDDFAAAILEEKPDLPVVKGEMPDSWIHGVLCDPGGVRLYRSVRPQLASAEALHTQLNLWGAAQPAIAKEVAQAYEYLLLYGEHTYGVPPAIGQYGEAFQKTDPNVIANNYEAAWEEKVDYVRAACKITRGIADANFKTLANNVKASLGAAIVYNPLPWSRSGFVEVNGETFFVKNVPACGYSVIPGRPHNRSESRATGNTLESEFFKLLLDPASGAIVSLVDKRTGREWADSNASHQLGQYLNERFDKAQVDRYSQDYLEPRGDKGIPPWLGKPGMPADVPYRATTCRNGTLKLTRTALAAVAELEMPADPANHMPATALRISLPENQPYIDLELTIQEKAKDNWPEADWLCLPFKIANPQFRVHRQLGVMNPVTDILPGANRHLYTVGHGVTIADASGAGIAICPIDHPLVSLDSPGVFRFSKDATTFTPVKPVVYVNLYNNQWNTNFRYWYPGTWSSRVRLWTFDATTPSDIVIATPAMEARNPLVAVAPTGSGTAFPAEQSGITLSRKGVLITAFGVNPDGAGTLLRVWEQAGVSGDLTVAFSAGKQFAIATPVNLRGEKTGEPIKLDGNRLPLRLKAYSPASFTLQ